MPQFEDVFLPDSKILVTGAGGFIGGHLIANLFERGFTNLRAIDIKPIGAWYQRFEGVDNLSLDLQEIQHCRAATQDVTVVFNLAADMGGMGFIEANKAACMLSSLINTHMLLASKENGVQRYFFSSSACVYNLEMQTTADLTPLKEADAYPAMPEDGYGWEKLFAERMCRHFTEDFGLETRIARFHNVYGPLGTWDGGREKAPAAICRKVATAAIQGKPDIEIWGDGEQSRSFMYIDDCLRGVTELMASDYRDPLNIGSAELVTINELVTMVEEIAGVKLDRRYALDAPKGVRGRNSDNTLIQKTLGWEPSIPLREGLEATYRWIHQEIREGKSDSIYNA
ncbi:MAG: NAD-dependent epimerase/dehydratase family protein [Myxococcota bacterium]|jgi:nucleoside-diphosphate-sugar epimerase|nr:NAD-dependent epimerase/dehydratase family protein [Myxococcota bacterium]